ncbi:ABC transporter permease [Xylanibacillus composti]|nr:ABC transporter permease [Xylanibacillus composti]
MMNLLYQYSKLSLKVTLEFKLDRSMITLAIFCREMIAVVVMLLILARFLHIRGWDMNQLFFLYSFLFLSYSLFVFIFAGVRDFDQLVHSGEFDRYLTRPRGLLFQVIASKIDLPATLGHGVVGLLLFMNTAFSVGIIWNASNILFYISVIVGGAVIQASIFMLTAVMSFWAIRIENVRNLIFFNARRIAGYPISFYPSLIQKMLIFIVPFSFVNYFPTQYFIRREDMELFWDGFMYMTPVVGVLMFVVVSLFWRIGVRSYSSSGNAMY